MLARIGVLSPLRHRDFALLWSGLTISLLGDGVYLVAIAWQVYELSDTPTALSVVGAAWTLPIVLLLLAGGVLSDRFDRRLLMVAADVLRAVAIGAIALLSITDSLELWHLLVLVAFYGVGEAIFNPAATAITPQLVPAGDLVQANALEHLVRPLALRFIGPALGGLMVATVGPGTGFALDAASFLVSALCIIGIRPRPVPVAEAGRSVLREVREGLAYVRSQPWLWATLCAASLSLLAFMGPLQVLLPDRLKNDLGFGAGTFGAVLAVGGLGRIAGAVVLGQRGLPRRFMTAMYAGWSLATLGVAGFGLSTAAWQFMAIALLAGVCDVLGNVTWGTLIQTRVPSHLLGRVSSVDWQVSIALVPISFGLAGPIAEAIGTQATLVGAGVISAFTGMAFLLLPGVRDPEREAREPPPKPAVPRPEREPV